MKPRLGPTALVLFVLVSCGSAETRQEVEKGKIQANLETYLPLLGEAYATGNLEKLQPWVAQKEVARVRKRIEDLGQQGRTLVPTFRQLTIEDINVWNRANAYVTTVEVWDLRVLATGTDQVLSEEIAQSNRVKYQLKRGEGRWRILFRTIQE